MNQPPNQPLVPDEHKALQRVMNLLELLLHTSRGALTDWVSPPAPASRMGQAFSAGLRDSYSMAHLLLFSAEDHLRTILAIRDAGPLPQFALYTLLRAASEAAVRSRYLLDASITETQRLARALNERLDNVIEQRRVDPDAMQTKFDEAVGRFEQQAVRNGIAVLREKGSGRLCSFGEPRKNLVDLFA